MKQLPPTTLWNSQLRIGSGRFDNQHKILFDLIKDTKIAINSGSSIRAIDALLSVLLNHFLHHFSAEEEYLRSHPDCVRHCLEHYEFLKKLNNYINNFRNKRLSNKQVSANYLADLWIDHIEKFDKVFFTQEEVAANLEKKAIHVDTLEYDEQDKRRHQRILHSQVVNGKILADCYNATQLLRRKASIIDMCPGGLKLQSTADHMVEDLLFITCSIGKSFKMKEKAKVVTARKRIYGVEFLAPAKETRQFFSQLYGSVFLNRATIA